MKRKIILLLTLLLISGDVFGKNGNRTKQIKSVHKKHNNSKYKVNNARIKRSTNDDIEKNVISGKGNIIADSNQYDYLDGNNHKIKPLVENEAPFWGNRGRRDSFSDETVPDVQLPTPKHSKFNKNVYKLMLNLDGNVRDQVFSLTSDRDIRDTNDPKDEDPPDIFFWANRGRRQDDDPFWGTRGRRHENESPFWGNRGRRENLALPFWISRDRYDDEEPFWGNRGRRQEQEPFWGNRGRREPFETFVVQDKNQARPFYAYRDVLKQKNELKNSIVDAINGLKNNIGHFERNRRENIQAPYWINRGRDSMIIYLFSGIARNRYPHSPNTSNKYLTNELHSKTFQQNTLHDDRIYAEEPHFILVERSSRSSAEDDPFYISRGKKYTTYSKSVRDRRGALEEIVKSVRNDPYYIARGKKDYIKIGKSNTTQSQFLKTRNLICSTVDLLMLKYSTGTKVKREAIDNDRDRRTILKKLALQLQMDPYFVSRGKKEDEKAANSDTLEQFINKVIALCN